MYGIQGYTRWGKPAGLALATWLLTAGSLSGQQAQPAPSGAPSPLLPPPQSVQSIATPATPQVAGAPRPASAETAADNGSTRLGAGDLIEINVYNVPELATKARIGNNGDVYLPLLDYVHIGDLTVDEAQKVLEKRLGEGGFVRSPHVTLFVDESTSQGVTLLGEIARPGVYPVLGDRKLYDVISSAGGFTAVAARKVSIVHRDQSQATTLILPRNLADDLTNNVSILPGDTINVPKAPVVYVVGDVGRPAGIVVDQGTITVLQAIALAGGTNHTARLNSMRIVRKDKDLKMTETIVPYKKILAAKAPDVTLEADDILFVPVSGARVAANRTIDAVAQVSTGMVLVLARP